jgi:hypothetical protein
MFGRSLPQSTGIIAMSQMFHRIVIEAADVEAPKKGASCRTLPFASPV